MELDGKKIVNNIYSKAKELDIKIGDIEKEVPVSLGYFSRFLKEDNRSLPSLESLYVAASKLNVTIDFLLSCNYNDMNEEELLVQSKLSILVLGTTTEKYSWNEIREKDFYRPIYEVDDENRIHPLATLDSHYNYYGQVDYVIKDYYSYFLEKNLSLEGSIFYLEVDSKTFYITKVVDDDSKFLYYEFYVQTPIESDKYKIFNLVNACTKDKFFDLLEELYKICVLKSQKFRLDILAKDALNSIK